MGMPPSAQASGPPVPLPPNRHAGIEWLMRQMFRPVFGWTDPRADPAAGITVAGLDASSLCAVEFAAQGTARGVVLLCHPFLKYGKGYFLANGYPRWLTAAGWHVVAFDFKGFGRSTLGGICFADDVKAMARWARARHPRLPLALLGASFGAFHATHAVARHGPMFDSAVFDSVPMSIAAYFDRGLTGALMRRISRSRWARPTATHDLFESLPAGRGVPSLYLLGDKDRFIGGAEIDRLRALCPQAQVRRFEGCGHLELRKRQPDDYMRAILDFLDTHTPRPGATGGRGN